MLEAMRIQEQCSFDSRHRVSVHELSIAERILAKRKRADPEQLDYCAVALPK